MGRLGGRGAQAGVAPALRGSALRRGWGFRGPRRQTSSKLRSEVGQESWLGAEGAGVERSPELPLTDRPEPSRARRFLGRTGSEVPLRLVLEVQLAVRAGKLFAKRFSLRYSLVAAVRWGPLRGVHSR